MNRRRPVSHRRVSTHRSRYGTSNPPARRIAPLREGVQTKALSGSLQGAGGVGGLLAVRADGDSYSPFCDDNGNVVAYADSAGAVVASYAYDAFGNTLSTSGSLASAFAHRFSTKPLDPETSLYYYGYRFYAPVLGRWMNRDPIEENGDVNVYCSCRNNPVGNIDRLGMFTVIGQCGKYTTQQIVNAIQEQFDMLIPQIKEPFHSAIIDNMDYVVFECVGNDNHNCREIVDGDLHTRRGNTVGNFVLRDVTVEYPTSNPNTIAYVEHKKNWGTRAYLCPCQIGDNLEQYGRTALHEAAHLVGWGGAYRDEANPLNNNLPPNDIDHPKGWGIPGEGQGGE